MISGSSKAGKTVLEFRSFENPDMFGRDRRLICPKCGELLLRGAGPRAAQGLLLMGKAYALLDGRTAVGCCDVARAFLPVMRHRIALTFEAQMAGETLAL